MVLDSLHRLIRHGPLRRNGIAILHDITHVTDKRKIQRITIIDEPLRLRMESSRTTIVAQVLRVELRVRKRGNREISPRSYSRRFAAIKGHRQRIVLRITE